MRGKLSVAKKLPLETSGGRCGTVEAGVLEAAASHTLWASHSHRPLSIGPHVATLLSRVKLLPEVVAKTSKAKAGCPLAGSGIPSQPGKAASTHLSEPMDKFDGF